MPLVFVLVKYNILYASFELCDNKRIKKALRRNGYTRTSSGERSTGNELMEGIQSTADGETQFCDGTTYREHDVMKNHAMIFIADQYNKKMAVIFMSTIFFHII